MGRAAALLGLIGLITLGSVAVHSQTYPGKPVRIVTAEPGGGADFLARLLAQGLTPELGQQIIVDNRPSGVIPVEVVAQAPADGYMLLFYSNGMWTLPLIQNVSYDPIRDFIPITLAGRAPNILVVHPSLPVRSVKELIALAKARPGQLDYGSAGPGSSIQLAADLFKSMAGVNIVAIPYRGGGPAVIALLGGEVQVMFAAAGSVRSHLKSGRLRGLAVTSARPSELFSEYPTIAATVPGYESVGTYGLFAPARTPAAIIARLNQDAARALNKAEVKEKLSSSGVEVAWSTPEEFSAMIKSEMTRLAKVLKDTGMRAGN
jgi:tripartite-type tricarboxylate transporter receptor subunit TctC